MAGTRENCACELTEEAVCDTWDIPLWCGVRVLGGGAVRPPPWARFDCMCWWLVIVELGAGAVRPCTEYGLTLLGGGAVKPWPPVVVDTGGERTCATAPPVGGGAAKPIRPWWELLGGGAVKPPLCRRACVLATDEWCGCVVLVWGSAAEYC